MEDSSKTNKKKAILSVASLVLLVVIVIGITYALFQFGQAGTKVNSITSGVVSMTYTEAENGITLDGAYPTTDSDGISLSTTTGSATGLESFDFTISTTAGSNYEIPYEITAVKQAVDGEMLANEDVRIYLMKSKTEAKDGEYAPVSDPRSFVPMGVDDDFVQSDVGGISGENLGSNAAEMVLDQDTLVQNHKAYHYKLTMWVSEYYDVDDKPKTFSIKVNVRAKDDVDLSTSFGIDGSDANPPELKGDMLPVVYNVSSKKWVIARESQTGWYNYDNQIWANAVTIKPASRSAYIGQRPGTEIDITDINTMWVWIPRYSYSLSGKSSGSGLQLLGRRLTGDNVTSELSLASPGAFDIRFIPSTKSDIRSGKYVAGQEIDFYTPSSFCWGDTCDNESLRYKSDSGNKELNGIWVSKFEISGELNADKTIKSIRSVPNEDSMRVQTHSSFYNAIKQQMNGSNGNSNYGFGTSGYDTHMMKNTEWGAMAYLSQSKYGKYGNNKYSGANKEIYINNYNSVESGWNNDNPGQTKTGCSSGEPSAAASTTCKYAYDVITGSGEKNGVGASTTGTIYGIYDVSGGAWEKMMGFLVDGSSLEASGFTSLPTQQRYWNRYVTDTSLPGNVSYIKGDATVETAGFYGDYTTYINSSNPWWARGGKWVDTAITGAFSFTRTTGGISSTESSRLVLVAA